MKFCVYADGTTTSQATGTTCNPTGIDTDAELVDEFELPDTSIEVHSNMFWVDLAVVALFLVPMLFKKRR